MRLLFLDNSTKLESIHDLTYRARGGMVSSLFILSDALSRMGHAVGVMADIQQQGVTDSGVTWRDYRAGTGRDYDFLICNRGINDGYPQIKAKRRILWTHDLPHNGFIPQPKTIRAFDATVFMSGYAERIWRAFYKTIGRSFLIPNGVDKTRFHPGEKDLDYLIYASAPNRGLKRLPLIFDAVRSRTRPSIYMKAFSNMAALHPNEVGGQISDDGFETTYKALAESDVQLLCPVPQHELAEELGRAGLMVLPTDYPEICSNIILQALASGTPVITTGRLGSVGEWLKHGKNGMLTEWLPVDYMIYHLEMVRNAIHVLNAPEIHRRMIERAAKTKVLTWEEVAKKWDRMFRKLI